jgi:hypothetical protein
VKKDRSWAIEVLFSLLLGLPMYLGGALRLGLAAATLVHLVFIACYALLLKIFGRNSAIEMGIFVGVWSVAVGIMLPVFLQ